MVVTAISSLGTVLKKEGLVIADVKGISGPSLSRDLADVTALDSANGFEEVLPTVLRTGDVTFSLSFNPDDSTHIALRDDVVTATGSNHGPSERMIVELDPEGGKAWGHYPGGQSGNPGSYYYDNMIEAWATGKYFDLVLFSSPDEAKNTIFSQTLTPAK